MKQKVQERKGNSQPNSCELTTFVLQLATQFLKESLKTLNNKLSRIWKCTQYFGGQNGHTQQK